MEFSDVVRRRKMVRSYTSEPVDPATVDLALRNATRAPSAGFTQGWSFLVLDTPEDTARYWDIFVGDEEWEADGWLRGMRTAPVLVLPCASTPRPTRAGRTRTRPAGRCRTGTWTPRWR